MPLTNDQKLLLLISKTDELLKEITRCEDAGNPHILKHKVKEMRKDLQLWIGLNRTVVTSKTPAARKKQYNSNHHQNWLGQ